MARLPVLPRVVIAETADRRPSLGYYALVLSDGDLRLIDYFDDEFVMPIAAFWRLVAEMESKGFRDQPAPAPQARHHRQTERSGRPRQAFEMHEAGCSYAQIAEAMGYRNAATASATVHSYEKRSCPVSRPA